MDGNTCYMFGHRDSPDEILPMLISVVEKHIIQYGVTCFVVGNYGRFDKLAAKAVACCKIAHSDTTLLMLLPYHPAERPIRLSREFDGSYYPPDMEKVPKRIAIVRANQYAVDHSDFIISYMKYNASNTANLMEYAKRRAATGKLKVTILKHLDNLSEHR